MNERKKIEKSYIDRSLGFDVIIRNAPMKMVWDEWALSLNKKSFQHAVLIKMVFGKGMFSGKQIRFIRQWVNESTPIFAKRFDVSHVTVLNWEKDTHTPSASAYVHMKLTILKSLPLELVAELFDSVMESIETIETTSKRNDKARAPLEFQAELVQENRYRELRVS